MRLPIPQVLRQQGKQGLCNEVLLGTTLLAANLSQAEFERQDTPNPNVLPVLHLLMGIHLVAGEHRLKLDR